MKKPLRHSAPTLAATFVSATLLSTAGLAKDPRDLPKATPDQSISEPAASTDHTSTDSKQASPDTLTKTILFEFDEMELSHKALDVINEHAQFLKSHPYQTVKLQGHADSQGEDLYNDILAEKRAESVANALIKSGVSQKQILVESFGDDRPKADNSQIATRANNRRVEFVYDDQVADADAPADQVMSPS